MQVGSANLLRGFMRREIEDAEGEIKEEESSARKVIVIIGSLVLALLVVSFVFVSFPIADIIGGKAESSIIINNTINLGNFSIILENGTYELLQDKYFSNPKVEISECLAGKLEGNNYVISSLYQPTIYSQAFNEVIFGPCSKDTLIMLHSHPYQHCIASETDIETLNKTRQENPAVLMVIMCEAKRFAVY